MINTTRSRAGRNARAEGVRFENALAFRVKMSGAALVKLPTGARVVGPRKLIPVKTPFDFVLARQGIAAFIDTKSTSEGTFKHDRITPHQLTALVELESQGFKAGYIVWFRKPNVVVFYSASLLLALRRGSGLRVENGISLGPVERIDLSQVLAAQNAGLAGLASVDADNQAKMENGK